MIGTTPVAAVTARDVLAILKPIWFAKPETAKRVLQRMEAVFRFAILNEYRETSPARASSMFSAMGIRWSRITPRCRSAMCLGSCKTCARWSARGR